MKITVFSGSPKGEDSITLQYVRYLEKQHPRVQFHVVHVGSKINKILREEGKLEEILQSVADSRGVLWIFPVYYFLIPSQLKAFIELLFETGSQKVFQGKYGAVVMTSIHFYDTSAAEYMRGICHDLGMRYAGEFMAEMYDLLRSRRRKNFAAFFRQFLHTVDNNLPTEVSCRPLQRPGLNYEAGPLPEGEKEKGRRVLLLTDEEGSDSNLGKMIEAFTRYMPCRVEVINISQIELKGGCLGCLRCAYDNQCLYRDDLARLYEEHILPAEALIFAGTLRDRYLSSRWKMFFDRSFYRGHTPVFHRKQMAFIHSGPLSQVPVLRNNLEAKVQFNRGNLVGTVTDEYETSGEVTALLKALAERLVLALETGQEKPAAFYGLAGHLIFRDFVFRNRGIFRGDHLYYKKHNLYNFPQKNWKNWRMNLRFMLMQRNPAKRRRFQAEQVKGMVKPLKNFVGE